MALIPMSPGIQPLGSFDCLDTDMASVKGGEVMTLGTASKTNTTTEQAAADVLDGYDYSAAGARAVAKLATAVSNVNCLSDDGMTGYFTMFGSLVGSTAGVVVAGSAVGPSTMAGSGKVTLWDKPGLYAVSLDACVSGFVAAAAGAGGLAPGSVLGHSNTGKLAPTISAGAVSASGVAYFVEFEGSQSLVTTPARLVGATATFDRIKLSWHAGLGNRTVAA